MGVDEDWDAANSACVNGSGCACCAGELLGLGSLLLVVARPLPPRDAVRLLEPRPPKPPTLKPSISSISSISSKPSISSISSKPSLSS